MEQRHRTIARECAIDAGEDPNLPMVAREASSAERTPVVEFARRPRDIDDEGRRAPLLEYGPFNLRWVS
jgi:hypothetical protein